MKLSRGFFILLVLSALLVFPSTAFLCGKERWAVKVAKDPHAKFLFKNAKTTGPLKAPKHTDIKTLAALDNPFKGKLPPDFNRVTGIETTIWEIEGTLFKFIKEDDEDYHLAIRDSSGNTMVVEIPAPDCLSKTPRKLKEMITAARLAFDGRFTATGNPKDASARVRITGPAMFDKKHPNDPIGDSPNHLEIHPVLKIEFLN